MKKIALLLVVALSFAACASTKKTNNQQQQQILATEIPKPSSEALSASSTPQPLANNIPTMTEQEIIKQYLKSKFGQINNNGKVFVAYEETGREDKEGMHDVFIFALIEEKYKQNSTLSKGFSTNVTLALLLQEQGDGVPVVTQHIVSSNLSAPAEVVDRLQKDVDKQAEILFAEN